MTRIIAKTRRGQAGFTIIELMIATAVLSTILVLVTVVMVNIGSLYYKGINQAKVQDNVRSINDEIDRYVQLSDQAPTDPVDGPNGTHMICVGPARYAYILGVQIGHPAPKTPPDPTTVYHQVLWRDTNPVQGSCSTKIDPNDPHSPQISLVSTSLAHDDAQNNGTELITDNSRLTEFSITAGSPSTVTVGVAYGDDDLLCNPTALPSSCTTSDAMNGWANYTENVLCKGGKGEQFCSTAQLTTSVVKRLGGDSF
ncbi:MAG TPA: type II secretion system protein [Candidatus Saccharimonadales bacterium]|nr:type II secretion system protein [Candidatus Saccharimonadales bacterium]